MKNNESELPSDVPPIPRPQKSRQNRVRRFVRHTIQLLLLMASLITIISWCRSYHKINDWLAPSVFGTQKSFFIGADRGTIYTGLFDDSQPYAFVTSSRFSSFTIENVANRAKSAGELAAFQFGYFRAAQRMVSSDFYSTNNVYVIRLQPLSGHGFYFPHSFALIGLGTLLVLVTFGRQFTLRGLMIWITVVCLLMGIQIAAASYEPPQVQGSGE